MKTSHFLRALAGAALLSSSIVSLSVPVLAHEANCPYCDMAVTQDTPTQDNETALKYGKKRVEYKCVYCAVSEAKTEFKGDLSISAPSEKKGKPVVLKRTGAQWSAAPATAAFVMPASKLKHRVCQQQSRAFTSKAAAAAYAKENNGQVVTLAQLVAQAD